MSSYDEDLLDEEDEEMPATERELADDAAWKIIQKNTFTRWANEHLKTCNKNISELETDFSDGLRLIGLVEVLSSCKFGRVNKKPNFRTQKLENVTKALDFLEGDQGIKIVNIDSGDIVDGKLKLILGLIWTLILHYSISMPMWEGEEQQPSEGGPTPKQRLLNWINSKVPELPIKNFTTDWNDGKAIGALVDAIAPGLCPDWEDWDPKKAKQNAKEAMEAAEKWLDVPQLIVPSEIVNPKVDDLSMMTYLAQFPKAKCKPGAPLRPKQNAGKVRAFGPGIEPKGNRIGQLAKFTVETFSAGKGGLDLKCLDPKGKELPVESVWNNDRNMTYTCTYTPAMEGEHRVIVKFGEKEIHKSPFKVLVEGATGDASKVSASGPGLEKTGVTVGRKTHFEVFTKDAGKGTVEVTILDPSGHRDKVKPTISSPNKDGVYKVEYTAIEMGIHSINISFSGNPIPKSPWGVNVGAALNPKAVYATGRGIQPRGVRVKQNAEFRVHTKDAGKAEVKVQIIGPGGININCTTKLSSSEEGVYECVYVPTKVGQYVINITFGGQHITKSPFRVDVGPEKTTKIVAFGPGLESGVVNQPACFTVETNGEVGALGFSIEGPSQAKIDCKDNGDGSADVTYWPTAPGEYAVHVLCNDEDIPQAPYMAQIQPATTAFDASKVIAKGPGLEKDGVIVQKVAEFTVDAKKAGKALLKITCIDANYKVIEVVVKDNKDGTFACKYIPKSAIRHTVIITWGSVGIPKSPFRVNVTQPSLPGNVKVFGPGVEKGVKTFVVTHFTVDCKTAGPGDVAIMLTDDKGQDVPVNTKDNKDGTFTIQYEPLTPGMYTVNVYFVGQEIPKSPIKVKVESSIDVGKVTVKGLETPIKLGEKREIVVVTLKALKKDGPCTITITTPSGKTIEMKLALVSEGYSTFFQPTEVGKHTVTITYGYMNVPKSPFTIMVEIAIDFGKVLVKGLESPIEVGEPRPVLIDTSSTGAPSDAPCRVMVTNPKGQTAELPVQKVPVGYATTFAPLEPGPHKVNVNFAGQEVPKSPFPVQVEPKVNVGAVKVKGLETPIEVAEPRPISIDTSSTGKPDAPCRVSVMNPVGQVAELPLKPSPEGYQTVFAPIGPGPHQVAVEYADQPVPGSPFPVDVTDVGQVKVQGLETPIVVGEKRPIQINTASTGKPDAPCRVTTTSPQGQTAELPLQLTPAGYQTVFAPLEPGPHKVNVNFADKEVPKSPFTVAVEPKVDLGAVEVLGLETPIKVGEPRPITVMTSTTGKPDAPCKVSVTNPVGKTMELPVRKIPEGYTATLAPQEAGPHKVNVDFNNQPVPKSPFSVMAEPAIDFSKVKVSGLEQPVEVGEIRPIVVDTAECGVVDAPCQLTATNPVGQVRDLPVQKTPKGYTAQFAPLEDGPHLVAVKYANTEVPKSPFSVQATPQGPASSKVKAYGPGLESGMATKPCNFTIDTRETTQPGSLGVTVEGPAESKIECRDNQDGTCDVTYFPTIPGEYSINITYAEDHIPKSPFKAKIQPSGDIDVSGVKAYGPGLEPGVFLDSPTGFTVDAKSVTPKGDGKVRAIVTSPSGQRTESLVKNKEDGTYDVLYTPYEEGPNTIDVTYEDTPIPQSPIKVEAKPGFDASRVKAYGPGLEGGLTDKPQVFTVDVRGAGQGGLALAIDGPAETQINCKDNRDGTCEVEYVPVKKGDYDITVKFADQHIPGSPFHVGIQKPVNPAKVKCYGPGIDDKVVKTNQPATFTVDTSEAGEAPLDVTYTDKNGKPVQADIVPLEEGKYQATYYPVDEGKCKVEVKYANQNVPNSPFSKVVEPGVDAKKVKLSGDGLQPTVLASLPVQFVIDTRDAGEAPLDVVIKRPDGTFIRPMVQDNGDGTFTVQYTPEDCGPYEISVTYGDQPVTEKPIKTTAVPTGDASKCKIKDGLQPTIPVEKETVITVDASQAGTGKVTCRIRSPAGAEIDIDIVENVDGTFSIMFTPAFPGDYSISIKFGGQSVPDGDYIVQVGEDLITQDTVDSTQAAAPGAGLYQPQEFRVAVGPIFSYVTGYIVMPSGSKAYPKIEDNKDGTVTIRYQPSMVGTHELHLCYNQQEIQGSPFKFHVDAINSKFVTAYGPGLSHGIVNIPAEFTIVTKDAGAGGLSLAIEGPSKTEIKCVDNGDGTCTVTYMPMAPGEYNITVKFADKNISGSPFVANITAGEPKQKAQIGRSSELSLKVTETDIANLTASILSPSGHEEPCMLKRLPNGHLGISFTPRETGEHLVNVYRDGQHIANSPFRITVGESELGNASKVKVYGKGLNEAMANEVNEFIVDTREAGYGGLSLSIEGPSKADIECLDNEDGTCRVTYKPTEPGTYIINIKFADEHVPGSPFNVKVGGEASEKITERIMRHREAADITHVGSECELSLKIPGTSPFDMTASVTSPAGVTELCDVVSLDDCHYSIKFVPKEMGIHTVSVKHKEMHIPGSPFQFTVGPMGDGGAHKVHAAGMGLVKGEIDSPNEFNIYTREAGAGGLSIAVEGPSKAEVDFEDRKDGSCGVTYTVSEPGEYMVSIKFNDEHIPDSPFRVPITPSIGDAKKISVRSLQSKGLTIGKPCSFVVNFNGAPKGKLQARVHTPSGTEDEALVQEIDEGEYAVRFIPRENGPHLVYVSFDGCQIPDSPFRIQVGTVHADPGMVQAYGDGLRIGKTGMTAKFIVNTINAGSGALAVTVEGPSKVKMECKEVDEGYEFSYTPTAPGDYLITIKYAGTNIAGSPFKARVEGQGKPSGYQEQASVVVETVTKTSIMSKFASLQPFESDASKVVCDGNGLKKGYRNKQCTFNVDCSKAGNNMLFIGMIGPKGPCEELCVKHQPCAPYKITYLVKERGDYMLAVKWGDEHIPGSPFYVKVE